MDQEPEFREDYDAMSPEEAAAQMERLEAAIKAHPASVASERWRTVQRAYMVWGRNMNELVGTLAVSESDEKLKVELIQNVRPDGVRRDFFEALDQRLFNMIGSAIALVERTNGFKKDYPDSTFLAEFETRNGAILDDPETKFIRKFRNYLVHVGAAPFRTTAKVDSTTGGEMDLKILLDGPSLLTRPDLWDVPSRALIEANPEGIHLLGVVQRYGDAMSQLFAWTFDQYEVLHSSDNESANDLVRRMNLTMTAGTTDGKDWEARMRHVQENLDADREGRPQTDFNTGDSQPPRDENE